VSATKAALFVLLLANTLYFALAGTTSEAIDAAAWLVLLALFMAETTFGYRFTTRRSELAVRATRLLAGAGVMAATIGYVFEDDVLDAANAVLWILVVILLEVELRWPALVERKRLAVKLVTFALYGGLALLVVLWAAAGMWFDAYDALLWLLAFATIELDVLTAESV
jgi:hypothetical protein